MIKTQTNKHTGWKHYHLAKAGDKDVIDMRKNARKFEIYRNPCNAKFTKASHWIRYSELFVVRVYRAIFCVIFADFQFTLLAIRNCKPLEWFTMGASNGLDKTLSRKLDIHSMLRYAARWSIRDILFTYSIKPNRAHDNLFVRIYIYQINHKKIYWYMFASEIYT